MTRVLCLSVEEALNSRPALPGAVAVHYWPSSAHRSWVYHRQEPRCSCKHCQVTTGIWADPPGCDVGGNTGCCGRSHYPVCHSCAIDSGTVRVHLEPQGADEHAAIPSASPVMDDPCPSEGKRWRSHSPASQFSCLHPASLWCLCVHSETSLTHP